MMVEPKDKDYLREESQLTTKDHSCYLRWNRALLCLATNILGIFVDGV